MLKQNLTFYLFFKGLIDLERGRERERQGEEHQHVVASHAPPTGDMAHNPGMCPGNQTGNPLVRRPALNLLSYTSQGHLLRAKTFS